MENFETQSKFTNQIKKIKTTDPAHADLFNTILEALLNNDVFLKDAANQLQQTLEQHTSDSQITLDAYYQQSSGYTDQKIAALINGAPSTLDTLGEIAQAMKDNESVVAALDEAIGKKASAAEFDSHVKNTTAHITSEERDKWNNGSANYGTCSSAAATAAKTVVCDGFELANGAEITVKFTITNTAANPTLNVNSTGAKPIYYRGAAITAGYLAANRTYTFRYNGTQYDLVGDIDSNTNNAVTQTNTPSTNASYRLLMSATADDTTRTEGARKDADLTYNPSTNTLKTGKVNADTADSTVTFLSGDSASPTGWEGIALVATGEKLSSLAHKFSLAVKNLRYLKNLLGSTSLADIGDGTVTGAIASLNTGMTKREIMAPYGYFGIEWNIDSLIALVRDGQWDKFAIGDYFIETTSSGEKIIWEVAGKNSYLHCGDNPELTVNHIVCCPRDCLQTYYKFNPSNTNAGGYAASLMPANLETEANKFSAKLQGYMTIIRRLENNKGTWAWASRRIFLPGNPELVGFSGFADGYCGGSFNQLPLFVGGNAHLLKGAGFNKSKAARMWYWTADPSAASTTNFCNFYINGDSNYNNAPNDGGVAPLIVLS